jgi:hypothetical protein
MTLIRFCTSPFDKGLDFYKKASKIIRIMKQWTLPSKYKCIADLFAFPFLFDHKKETLEWMNSNEIIQKLIALIAANTVQTSSIHDQQNEDDRLKISRQVHGKHILKSMIGWMIVEHLGYNVGNYGPSKFFADHADEIPSAEDSLTFCELIADIDSKWRAASYDYGVYIAVNGLHETFNAYWYHAEENRWMKDLRTHTKLIFRD